VPDRHETAYMSVCTKTREPSMKPFRDDQTDLPSDCQLVFFSVVFEIPFGFGEL
jgi:hypothetical protein